MKTRDEYKQMLEDAEQRTRKVLAEGVGAKEAKEAAEHWGAVQIEYEQSIFWSHATTQERELAATMPPSHRRDTRMHGLAAVYRERGADWCRLPENGK